MIVYDDFVQYSPAFWEARRGFPTASEFHRIVMPASGNRSSASGKYLYELVKQHFEYDPPVMTERPMNPAMRHGVECEAEARSWYAFEYDRHVRQVGFVTTDDATLGCSPDGLVVEPIFGHDVGVLELKCPQPATHEEYLKKGTVPTCYRCQVHGQLIVTGLPWADFVSYCPGQPPLVVRVVPDYFTDVLRAELAAFRKRYDAVLEALELTTRKGAAA